MTKRASNPPAPLRPGERPAPPPPPPNRKAIGSPPPPLKASDIAGRLPGDRCDCTVFCGDDPWLRDGRATPCETRQRELTAAATDRDTGPTEPRHELAGLLRATVSEARFWHRGAVAAMRSKRTETSTIGRVLLDTRIDERTRAAAALMRTARGLKTLLDTHYPRRAAPLPRAHMEGSIYG